MRGLEGRVLVVAGGAGAIGTATAKRLGEERAKVVVADKNEPGARQTAKEIIAEGGTAVAVSYDQGDPDSCAAVIQAAIDHFGAIDGLHANAAEVGAIGADGDLLGTDLAVWERSLRVNLLGYVFLIRSTLPHLLAKGGGPIVCTSSNASTVGLPNRPTYAASKAGVNAVVRHVASAWGKQGIRINAINPFVVSDVVRERMGDEEIELMLTNGRSPRLGVAEDPAGLVAFLFSDDACYINGQIISINGGSTLGM